MTFGPLGNTFSSPPKMFFQSPCPPWLKVSYNSSDPVTLLGQRASISFLTGLAFFFSFLFP